MNSSKAGSVNLWPRTWNRLDDSLLLAGAFPVLCRACSIPGLHPLEPVASTLQLEQPNRPPDVPVPLGWRWWVRGKMTPSCNCCSQLSQTLTSSLSWGSSYSCVSTWAVPHHCTDMEGKYHPHLSHMILAHLLLPSMAKFIGRNNWKWKFIRQSKTVQNTYL